MTNQSVSAGAQGQVKRGQVCAQNMWRRARRPFLATVYPGLAQWRWYHANPYRWNVYGSNDGGATWALDGYVAGTVRQYDPASGLRPFFVVGVDAGGSEVTGRSNVVRPDDARMPGPVLVSAGSLLTWSYGLTNPNRWFIYQSTTKGATWLWASDYWTAGANRSFMPDGSSQLFYVVGVDAGGNEITERSNLVCPDDVLQLVPMTVSGLKLWTRMETLEGVANGTGVATWRDSTFLGADLVQATGAQQPLVERSADGERGVMFDGSNDVLATAATAFATATHHIFIVCRPAATDSSDLFGTGGVAGGDILIMFYGQRVRGHIWRSASSNMTDTAGIIIYPNVWMLVEQEVTATELILRVNGREYGRSVLTGTPDAVSKRVFLASRLASWYLPGRVREVLVYQGNMSARDAARVREYVMQKNGLPPVFPPPPAPGAPTDLFGEWSGPASVSLTWDMSAAPYATGTEIQRKLFADPDANYVTVGLAGYVSDWTDETTPGIAVDSYRVRAFNSTGASAWSVAFDVY